MAIRHQYLLLIHTLYCAAIIHGILLDANDTETCNLLCEQCNASAVFTNSHCECSSADNDEECIQRIQKEIQAINLNILSDDPTDEERSMRSILKSRRRLRMGDADKVAQYFINGGPAAGHSHFVRAFKTAHDSTDSATNSFSGVVGKSTPENEFYGVPLISSISRSTCDSPLYMVPEEASRPSMPSVGTYTPIIGTTNPAFGCPANGVYDPTSPLLGSIIHPYGIHRHGLLHPLLRAATFPRYILHNALTHRLSHHHPVYHHSLLRSANPLQDGLPLTIDQSYVNSDGSTVCNSPTTRDNEAQPVTASVPVSLNSAQYFAQTPYVYSRNAIYQPMQYQHFDFPHQYTSYYNPLINMQPVADEYILPHVSHYVQDTSNPQISASNPNSYCTNNANTEQSNEAATTTEKTIYSNTNVEKSNNVIKNNNNGKKTEKSGSNKL